VILLWVGTLIVFMLWPHYNYTFRFDPEELLALYVDREPPSQINTRWEVHGNAS
jgi:hypothetical protein